MGDDIINYFSFQFPWYLFMTILSFPLGACIGSFLNVCIYRIPRGLSVISPRSHCPACEKLIPWYLNIPIFSYLLLRGRCRFCGARFTSRYFIVELTTAVIFLLIWFKFTISTNTILPVRPLGVVPINELSLIPVYWFFVSGLILGTFVDFEHLIIPDRVTLGGILTGLLLSGLIPQIHGETQTLRGLLWSSLGAMTGWFSLWGAATLGTMLLKKEAMGFGDVKLLGAIGAFLGTKAVIFVIIFSSLLGSLFGISLVIIGRKSMQSRIPFGPFLALAAVVWILWGPIIMNWYMNLFSAPLKTTSGQYYDGLK